MTNEYNETRKNAELSNKIETALHAVRKNGKWYVGGEPTPETIVVEEFDELSQDSKEGTLAIKPTGGKPSGTDSLEDFETANFAKKHNGKWYVAEDDSAQQIDAIRADLGDIHDDVDEIELRVQEIENEGSVNITEVASPDEIPADAKNDDMFVAPKQGGGNTGGGINITEVASPDQIPPDAKDGDIFVAPKQSGTGGIPVVELTTELVRGGEGVLLNEYDTQQMNAIGENLFCLKNAVIGEGKYSFFMNVAEADGMIMYTGLIFILSAIVLCIIYRIEESWVAVIVMEES